MMISDKVFLIEYYLHNQLLMKLRMSGKNALFCYRTSIKINGNSITGIATGTAVCLRALPISKPLKIVPSLYLHQQGDREASKETFKNIEVLSRFNIKHLMEQSIVSIQSPYTYIRELPKKRVLQNLVEQVELDNFLLEQKTDGPREEVKVNLSRSILAPRTALRPIREQSKEASIVSAEPPKLTGKPNEQPLEGKTPGATAGVAEVENKTLKTRTMSSTGIQLRKSGIESQKVTIQGDDEDIKTITEAESEVEQCPDTERHESDKNQKSHHSVLQEKEEKVIVLVNNPLEQSPQRIDFSGLKADDDDPASA